MDHRVMWQEIREKKLILVVDDLCGLKENSAINKKRRWDFIFEITAWRRNDNTACH